MTEREKIPQIVIDASDKRLIERAVSLEGCTLAEFVRLAAITAARQKIRQTFGTA